MSVERGEDITLRFSLKGAKSAKALIYEIQAFIDLNLHELCSVGGHGDSGKAALIGLAGYHTDPILVQKTELVDGGRVESESEGFDFDAVRGACVGSETGKITHDCVKITFKQAVDPVRRGQSSHVIRV